MLFKLLRREIDALLLTLIEQPGIAAGLDAEADRGAPGAADFASAPRQQRVMDAVLRLLAATRSAA